MWLVELYFKLQGRESGLEGVSFVKLQTAKTYFDPSPSREALGYGKGGLKKAFVETVRACLK
jgi:hypothetical protein